LKKLMITIESIGDQSFSIKRTEGDFNKISLEKKLLDEPSLCSRIDENHQHKSVKWTNKVKAHLPNIMITPS
jgi:hypothetical protein